jgi:hypothetical protein
MVCFASFQGERRMKNAAKDAKKMTRNWLLILCVTLLSWLTVGCDTYPAPDDARGDNATAWNSDLDGMPSMYSPHVIDDVGEEPLAPASPALPPAGG